MSDSYNCALCTDAEATTRYDGPRFLAAMVTQKTIADVYEPDVVIPLCEECNRRVEDLEDERRSARTPDDKQFAEERLVSLAQRLNTVIIEEASE